MAVTMSHASIMMYTEQPYYVKHNTSYTTALMDMHPALLQAEDEDDDIEEIEEMDDLQDVEMHDALVDGPHRSYTSSHNTTPESPLSAQSNEHSLASSIVSYSYEEDKGLLSLEDRFPFLKDDRKRTRKLLSPDQTRILEAILERTVYPSTPLREAVARQLGIPPRKVQIWFQNKRQGRRRQSFTNANGVEVVASSVAGMGASTTTEPSSYDRTNSIQRHQSREHCLEMQSKADDMRLAVLRDEQGRQFAELRLDSAYCDGEQHPAPMMGHLDSPSDESPTGNGPHFFPGTTGNAARTTSWHLGSRSSTYPQRSYGAAMQRVGNLSEGSLPLRSFGQYAGQQSAHGYPQQSRVQPSAFSPTGPIHPSTHHSRCWKPTGSIYTHASPTTGTPSYAGEPLARPSLHHSNSYSALQEHHSYATARVNGRLTHGRGRPTSTSMSYPKSQAHDVHRYAAMMQHTQRLAINRRSTYGNCDGALVESARGRRDRPHLPELVDRPALRSSDSLGNLRAMSGRRMGDSMSSQSSPYMYAGGITPHAYSVSRSTTDEEQRSSGSPTSSESQPSLKDKEMSMSDKSSEASTTTQTPSTPGTEGSRQREDKCDGYFRAAIMENAAATNGSTSVDSAMQRPPLSQLRMRSLTTTTADVASASSPSTKSHFQAFDAKLCLPPIVSLTATRATKGAREDLSMIRSSPASSPRSKTSDMRCDLPWLQSARSHLRNAAEHCRVDPRLMQGAGKIDCLVVLSCSVYLILYSSMILFLGL